MVAGQRGPLIETSARAVLMIVRDSLSLPLTGIERAKSPFVLLQAAIDLLEQQARHRMIFALNGLSATTNTPKALATDQYSH